MDDDSSYLLRRCRNNDDEAAAAIFDRYVARLLKLARRRLIPQLDRRLDAEDVVQSAFRSFFRKARSDEVVLDRAGDLWRLLAAITINKTRQKVEHHTAQKRDIGREESWSRQQSASPPAIFLLEEVELLMAELSERDRHALELRLQGEGVPRIAQILDVAEMTVRRILNRCGERLRERLQKGE